MPDTSENTATPNWWQRAKTAAKKAIFTAAIALAAAWATASAWAATVPAWLASLRWTTWLAVVIALVVLPVIFWPRQVVVPLESAAAVPAPVVADRQALTESRLTALESMVSALHADQQQLGAPPAPVPRPASTRAAPASVPAATATPPTFGVTDLDRRLAAFQAQIDAAPSLTTTNPETAP